jgi:hypothetical protein
MHKQIGDVIGAGEPDDLFVLSYRFEVRFGANSILHRAFKTREGADAEVVRLASKLEVLAYVVDRRP